MRAIQSALQNYRMAHPGQTFMAGDPFDLLVSPPPHTYREGGDLPPSDGVTWQTVRYIHIGGVTIYHIRCPHFNMGASGTQWTYRIQENAPQNTEFRVYIDYGHEPSVPREDPGDGSADAGDTAPGDEAPPE